MRPWKHTPRYMPLQPLFELNPAESILAPFHDKLIAPQLSFQTEPDRALHFRREPNWCTTRLVWDDCPPDSCAGSATLLLGVIPDRFDHFIFCTVIPEGISVQFEARVNGSWIPLGEPVISNGGRVETLRRRPAGQVEALRVSATPSVSGPSEIALNWWGVQEAALLDAFLRAKPRYSGDWEGLILPDEKWGAPAFITGLLFGEDDLPALRKKAEIPLWKDHLNKLSRRARAALDHDPLHDLDDYLPWSDYRYLRERERNREAWMAEPVLCGLVGLLEKDAALIRHALHYLMCFVHTRHWCQSAESRARGSTWDQRCFLEEMATTTCALLYDWFGHLLTDRGRELVRFAIWDKGLSIIQRDMVAWEYVYGMNQGPWFCRARILGGLVLEPDWPRVAPYIEQAYADMLEGMNNYLLPDGGTDEGVGYFCVTLQAVLPGLLAYARSRGKAIQDVLPQRLAKSGDFVAILSAMDPGGVLLDGDNSNDRITGDSIPILAAIFPEEVYPKIAAATLLQLRGETYYRQYMIDGPFAFIAGPDSLPQPRSIVPTFGRLPHTGHLTSRRAVKPGREVRIHLAGCKALASHTHFDKGAFTLELDREPVFIDRGVVRYDDIRHLHLKRTEFHNVLAPRSAEGVHCQQPLPDIAVIPEGEGDEYHLSASIDLSHVWREIMSSATRLLLSEDPSELLVRDQGVLNRPMALHFHLHTRHPWHINPDEKSALLQIPGWSIRMDTPWAATLSQRKDNIDHRYEPVWHLEAILPPGPTEFSLETRFTFDPINDGS